MIGIYGILNKINKNIYIGQSVRIKQRWRRHIVELNNNLHKNDHLQAAWNKYGEENFIFQILEECSKEKLNEKEKFWFDYYSPNTYNLQGVGLTKQMSKETKQKISNSNKGRISWNKGKHLSEEHRKKISESSKGRPGTKLGLKMSEETKRKISLANKGNKKCANSKSFQKGHLYHSKEIRKEVI